MDARRDKLTVTDKRNAGPGPQGPLAGRPERPRVRSFDPYFPSAKGDGAMRPENRVHVPFRIYGTSE